MGVLPVHVKLVRTPNYGHRAGKLYASNGVSLINFSEVFRIANEIQESLETLLAKPGHFPGNVLKSGAKQQFCFTKLVSFSCIPLKNPVITSRITNVSDEADWAFP